MIIIKIRMGMIIIESQLLSLSKIFTEKIFRIPDYQRGYAWNEKQVKEFWNDLQQLEQDRNHYVGVVTLEMVPKEKYRKWEEDFWIIDSKSYDPYYVVDGQQRLTTSIILIQSILECIGENQKLNFTSKEEIKKKFIFESKDEGISKSFLFGYEKDNPSHEYLKTKILQQPSDNNFTLQETVYTYNLEKAKDIFKEELKSLTLEELETIFKKLSQHFLFNFYTITADIDVYVAFETMNNRGKPLSYLELLKNRLIYLSTKLEEVESYEKETLRKNINECWKDIYKYLGMNKLKPLKDDEFLSYHFMIYFWGELNSEENDLLKFGRVDPHNYVLRRMRDPDYSQTYLLDKKFTIKNLFSTSEETISISYINDYVNSLKISVLYWNYIHNSEQSNYLDNIKLNLKRITKNKGHIDILLLILVFLQKTSDSEKILTLLQSLEKFIFLRLLTSSSRLYDIKIKIWDTETNLELAKNLFWGKITIDDVMKTVQDAEIHTRTDMNLQPFIKARFRRIGFYNWDGINYYLFEYEQYIKSIMNTDREKLFWDEFTSKDYKSIEHIFPQNARAVYWNERFSNYSPRQRDILKNSLGNLVPISQSKNSSLSNKPFPDKKGIEKNKTGYRYGSYSEIHLTHYTDWTANTILDRGIELLDFMEKRWGYRIGDGSKEDKIDFLALEFLIPKKKKKK